MGDLDQGQTEELNQNQEPQEQEQEQPAPETEEKPPEEIEAKEAAPETGESEAAASDEEQPKAEEKHRREGGWKRKIERQERELEFLRSQLAQQQRPVAQPAAEEKPKDPVAQFQEAVRAEARAVLAAEREAEQQAKAQAEFQRRTQEARAKYRDFDDVLEDVSHIPVSSAVQQTLLTSTHGTDLMYMLAKNPAELARISALPPFEAAREIGRLEAKVSSTAAPTAAHKTASRPPAPPTTVAGSSASSTRRLEDLPIGEYKRAIRSGRR